MTKREIINLAFEEIGIASYNFDIQPEQYISALRRLDNLMLSYQSKGIEPNYVISNPISGASLEDDAIISDGAIKAIYSNLALDLCPMFGKSPSPINVKNANIEYKKLLNSSIALNEAKKDKTVLGSGYKPVVIGYNEFTIQEA